MNIGIRKNEMPMFIKGLVRGLVTLGLLTSQVYGDARTSNFDESKMVRQNLQQPVTIRSIDSISDVNRPRTECSAFKVKQLILPGALITVGTLGVYSGAFKKLNTNIKNGMDNLRKNTSFMPMIISNICRL